MKPHIQTIIATAILFISPGLARAADVTIRGIVISLPNDNATQFSSQYDLNGKPADALKALEKLVTEKKATSVANPSVTTRSGTHASSESGKTATLEVEPVVSPDGKTADVLIIVTDQGHKVQTSCSVPNDAVKFLGSVQNPKDNTKTDYIFVRVSF